MNSFKRKTLFSFAAVIAGLALIALPAIAGSLDFGTQQIGKEVVLKANVPVVGTFTVSPGLDLTRITATYNPNTRGSAAVSLDVACAGVQVASLAFGMNTAATRPMSFPTSPGNCKFQLTSKQDIAFTIVMKHDKVEPPPPPKRR